MADTFKCFHCGETYEQAWTNKEAVAAKDKQFPDVAEEDCEEVCESCYRIILSLIAIQNSGLG